MRPMNKNFLTNLKLTPEPYKVQQGKTYLWQINDASRGTVAGTFCRSNLSEKEEESLAKLFCAAPNMLAGLEILEDELKGAFNDKSRHADAIAFAISKIESLIELVQK